METILPIVSAALGVAAAAALFALWLARRHQDAPAPTLGLCSAVAGVEPVEADPSQAK